MGIDQPTVRIHNLNLATALVCVGHEAVLVHMSEDDGMVFEFARTRKLRRSADKYWANKLRVKARSYSDTKEILSRRALRSKLES